MDPGLADREGSGLADDIATADFLVLTNIWTGWNEPNASDEHLSDEHNQAVADNFCLVGQLRGQPRAAVRALRRRRRRQPRRHHRPLPNPSGGAALTKRQSAEHALGVWRRPMKT